MLDVIVIGGGPAGLSAALCLGRARRTALLVDAGEGRNRSSAAVHNLFAHDGTPPAELRRLGRQQLAHYPTVSCADTVLTDVAALSDGTFRATLEGGEVKRARRLLLATGLIDELPPMDGLAPLWGRSAFHCPYCHGYETTGRRIAVIGDEPERARLALHLTRFSDDVVLCTNGAGPAWPASLDAALEKAGVSIRTDRISMLEADGHQVRAVLFEVGEPLLRDALFIKSVLRQRSDLAHTLGCAMLADNCVEVNEFGQTSVPGVSAAGDMARRTTVPVPLAAVVAAAASGTVAATIIDQDLIGADFGLPTPFPSSAV